VVKEIVLYPQAKLSQLLLRILVCAAHAVTVRGPTVELHKLPGAKLAFKLRFARPWMAVKETVMLPQVNMFLLRVHPQNIVHAPMKQITLFLLVLSHVEQELKWE